ncbi:MULTISPECIES: valine--pyruvate transaminase [Bacillus]|uniref:valine--pyruvate transaminase n=1 Tax=Bacillus TaxID=1386 RepID=UPI0015838480|nr:valine--pyruvate transaminase [Bacillus glycinifermentans]MBU8786157.1 valine--pyruvate transaminase [Bacillus glycinifermentans]NUJ16684.1 valine--pyruvate transaminase [Bacillus glycinifermentans]
MKPKLSIIGEKMNEKTGIRAVMGDIQEILHVGSREYLNLSAGNPMILQETAAMWQAVLERLLENGTFLSAISQYGSSYGTDELINSVVRFFSHRYGHDIEKENVLITAGSQQLLFFAINLFCGMGSDGVVKKALIPMLPDYAGYSGAALDMDTVEGIPPLISTLDDHMFRYELDRERFLKRMQGACDIGAVVLSRPNNPSGNVLSEEDVLLISDACRDADVPLLIDSAYAPPFPAINFIEMEPVFTDQIIHCISLSKAGLPGERVGIAIGHPRYMKVMEAFQSNAAIHSSRLGQYMAAAVLDDGRLAAVSQHEVRPYYHNKFLLLKDALLREMPGDIKWHLHRGEGSLFGWLWIEDLPVADIELYARLKANGVIIVPGASFFHHVPWDSPHVRQCIRISLTAADEDIKKGVGILAGVVEGVCQDEKLIKNRG